MNTAQAGASRELLWALARIDLSGAQGAVGCESICYLPNDSVD